MQRRTVPSYGGSEQSQPDDDISSVAEEIARTGVAVVNSGYSPQRIDDIKATFDDTHRIYLDLYNRKFMLEIDEANGIKLPLAPAPSFVELAANARILALVEALLRDKFILNHQLAINALYCVDDFTLDNGAASVIPASHKQEPFPSADYIDRHALQISAPAGSFRQQIDISEALWPTPPHPELSELRCYRYRLPRAVTEFLSLRSRPAAPAAKPPLDRQ